MALSVNPKKLFVDQLVYRLMMLSVPKVSRLHLLQGSMTKERNPTMVKVTRTCIKSIVSEDLLASNSYEMSESIPSTCWSPYSFVLQASWITLDSNGCIDDSVFLQMPLPSPTNTASQVMVFSVLLVLWRDVGNFERLGVMEDHVGGSVWFLASVFGVRKPTFIETTKASQPVRVIPTVEILLDLFEFFFILRLGRLSSGPMDGVLCWEGRGNTDVQGEPLSHSKA